MSNIKKNSKTMKKTLLLSFAVFFAFMATAQKLPFQGKLIEAGAPVNGTHNFSFSIDTLWAETHSNVAVTDGLYFVVLGSINPIPAAIFSGTNERQLELSVDGTALSPVTLYKPLSGDLSQLNVKGPGNGIIGGGFGTGSNVNQNLPNLKLNGNLSTLNNRVTLRVSSNNDNTVETGHIDLSSTSGFLSYLSPDYFGLNYGNTPNVQFFSQNWSGKGHTGYAIIRGPNSTNLEIGSKFWENSDLPWINMRGTTENPVMNLSGEKYEENGVEKERGVIVLQSTDGRKSSATSNHFTVNAPDWRELVYMGGYENNGKLFGVINISGPTSNNIQMGSGGDPDQGTIGMNGKTNELRARMFVKTDWDQQEKGTIELHGEDGNKVGIIPTQFALHTADWGMSAALKNTSGAGELELRGPNTRNFFIGSTSWENTDKPWFNMNGKDDQVKITMTTIGDEFEERGILTITNNNGEETTYANNGTWGTLPFNMWSGAMVNGTLTVNGDINGSGTNNYNSDKRLKKDIQPLGGSTLNKIESLGGYSYFWKKEEFPEKNFSAEQQIGLLAQELEAQFPALVKTGDDGFKSVNYNGFTAVLLEAVKELNAKMEKLESENRTLQAELSASANQSAEMAELKNQVDFLTKLVQEKITSATGDSEKTAEKK